MVCRKAPCEAISSCPMLHQGDFHSFRSKIRDNSLNDKLVKKAEQSFRNDPKKPNSTSRRIIENLMNQINQAILVHDEIIYESKRTLLKESQYDLYDIDGDSDQYAEN
jgi:hypothetical protein